MQFVPPARHLLSAKDLADARFFEPLGVDDLARAAGPVACALQPRVPRRLRRVARTAYLLTRRMERAAALLRTTDRSVADVCLSVGLQSIGSFTTSFKRTYGMTPTAYRASFPAGRRQRAGAGLRGALLRPPATQHISRRQLARPRTSVLRMIKLSHAQLWVHDQDEALAFYTEKLGMEVRADVTLPEMGDFRWLTVGPPGQEDVVDHADGDPGPAGDGRRRPPSEVRNLMSKGFAGTIFLTTDDVHASYEELKEPRRRVHRDSGGAPVRHRLAGSVTRPGTASG